MRALGYFLFDPEAPPGSPSSRASQQRELARFCQREAHTLEATFPESKATAAEGRQGLQRLLQHLQEQRGNLLVVVSDPLHLGATLDESLNAVLSIDALGFRVVSTAPGRRDAFRSLVQTIHTTGPGADRRQRILNSMQSKAIRGEGLGKPPYGYRIGNGKKLEEVSEEAKTVRLIFSLYLQPEMGLRNIARHLNQERFRTRRGGNWSLVTIRDILRNRTYTGTYQRFGMRVPRNHPPLVSLEDFRRVQELMQARTPTRHQGAVRPYLLSGLAYCAQCGNPMAGVTRRQTWRKKDGQRVNGVYRYYQCHSRINQSICGYHTWRAQHLEEAVLNQLRQNLQGAAGLPPGPQAAPGQPASADSKQNRNRRRLYVRYLRQAADGAISLQRLRSLLGALEQGVTTRDANAAVDGNAILEPSEWGKLDSKVQQQLLQHWIERIDVGDEKAKVTVRQGSGG